MGPDLSFLDFLCDLCLRSYNKQKMTDISYVISPTPYLRFDFKRFLGTRNVPLSSLTRRINVERNTVDRSFALIASIYVTAVPNTFRSQETGRRVGNFVGHPSGL